MAVGEIKRDFEKQIQAIRSREADARPIRDMLFSEQRIFIDEINFPLIEWRIQGGRFSGLGFLGSSFSFFHASTAARLVKKAHNS